MHAWRIQDSRPFWMPSDVPWMWGRIGASSAQIAGRGPSSNQHASAPSPRRNVRERETEI
jgi:hypothetical protein